MNTPAEPSPAGKPAAQWNYVEIQVIDGERALRPTHIAFDQIIFARPPQLSSRQVEIIITNNGESHSSQALILPHDLSATRIPIELITTEQKAHIKLTA
jgi:hypothetical protein